MRRRNSTNPRRIDRRKSVTSVKSVRLEHISPDKAEYDARVAATQAFERARARSSTDSAATLWPPSRPFTSPGNSTLVGPGDCRTQLDESPVHRHQSVRFVQPRHRQGTSDGAIVKDSSCIPHSSKHGDAHLGNGLQVSSNASASGMVSAIKGAAGDYINILFTGEEYYTPEDDIASMPSSYRKLRKSRSMFTNRPPVAVVTPQKSDLSNSSSSADRLPSPEDGHYRPPDRSVAVPSRGLVAPKSMSFLRDFRENFVTGFKSDYSNAPSVSTTRYTGSLDNTRDCLRPKPSKFLRPSGSGQERVFKKSMREMSDSAASIKSKTINGDSLRHKARKVSLGLKNKIKNLFTFGQEDNNIGLPMQHIDAQQSRVLDLGYFHQNIDEHGISSRVQASLSHVASGVPSLHSVPSCQQLRSRQGSVESLQSDQQKSSDDRSRVTSWSNSETNTVLTYNSAYEERERKRLSIINENGAHVCSSSARFLPISEQSNASTASLNPPVQPAPPTADHQRIYSALIKRMNQPQQTQSSTTSREVNGDEASRLGLVPQCNTSLNARGFGGPNATIRYVMPESESDSESMRGIEKTHRRTTEDSLSTTAVRIESRENETSAQIDTRTDDVILSDNNEKALPVPTSGAVPPLLHTLSSRSSAFFGSPTRHLFRTQSPFRRALRDRIHKTSNEQQLVSSDFNPWMRSISNLPNLPIQPLSTHGSDADIKLQYTESIYSTNTEDGPTRRHSPSSVAEDNSRSRNTYGDATIFVNPPATRKRSLSLPPKPRVSSSASSVEWKTWLSSNVSKLEETDTKVNYDALECSIPSAQSSGHVRENAQIYDEEEDRIQGSLATTSQQQLNQGYSLDLEQGVGDNNKPTYFDAGGMYFNPTQRPKPFERIIPTDTPNSSVASPTTSPMSSPRGSPVTYPKAPQSYNSKELFKGNREKELPKVPSLIPQSSSVTGRASIAAKPTGCQPKQQSSMTPLTNRSLSGVGEDQHRKSNSLSKSRHKPHDTKCTKPENVSPAATGDDSWYGAKGACVLGRDDGDVGGKKMVDIFLSSRRRRIISDDDDGSVFL